MSKYTYPLVVLFIVGISCDNDSEPVYPNQPFIESGKLEFINGVSPYPGAVFPDTLELSFKFRDGDFDLGIDHTEFEEPYHHLNFLADDNGKRVVVISKSVHVEHSGDAFLLTPGANQQGKLLTYRGLVNSNQTPVEFSCRDYHYFNRVLLSTADSRFIENLNTGKITLSDPPIEVFELKDTFLIEHNPNHYNIAVEYQIEQPDGSFSTFDWQKQFCQTFDSRFPLLTGKWTSPVVKAGPFKITRLSKQRAELAYSMQSLGFRPLFGGKKVKIKFAIKDRALNQSNIYETEPILIPK